MAADPTLADRLDAHARWDDEPPFTPPTGFAADLRAAAVRLRKLDAIDPSELRRLSEALVDWSSDPGPDELAEASIVLSRIADALGGTE